MKNDSERVALVTGASRGVGASVAGFLAEAGFNVVINYHSKSSRAEEVAHIVREKGREALLAQADLTSENEMKEMIKLVQEKFGCLDLLVLNASGGLEKGKDADYPMQLNLTAQKRAVDLSLPLMLDGGRIVFVTSHLAHFHGVKPVYPLYEPIAQSKKAGEEALRAYIPELSKRDIKLIIVSGDLIEGTITPKLMQRQNPGLIETRRKQAGVLPTAEEFARAIASSGLDKQLETGTTIFVGSTDWEI
ncbi:short-chain dehydrogenase/reductase SDR [Calothrix sp. NIES-4071]|nr:short-chain dehydrogenase/reductase SDR [Calothrix sp. NIES-4071]BAZ58933.1 short-chain dehydrogenase/reductase SDR [Calothrix sp. NIES-4105]